ncbi:MAG: FapA family protein [Oscillospiraceae bacterium]|nr:FapA family protein [Oscillospiraceae bacterium]
MSDIIQDQVTEDEAVTAEEEQPTAPQILLKVSPNRMEAEIEIITTSVRTLPAEFSDVMKTLEDGGVKFGISEDQIRALCKDNVYHHPMVVARGKREEVGADGYIKYHVSTETALKPKEREDGTVDYRDLGLIQNVTKGALLAEIFPEQKGEDGMDVLGNVLPGRFGKKNHPIQGKNTVLSEDGLKLMAGTDGDAKVKKGVVEVVDVFRVNGDVDNSTGDIDFIGDVQINGDVLSGFKITSGGNITIKGTVEGATLKAAGDIVISEGVNGMNQSVIEASGTLKCKYIQNAHLKVKGSIYADTIIYSVVECSGNVELNGKKGTLIGGKTTISGGYLNALAIGTSSHVATQIVMQNEDRAILEEKEGLLGKFKDLDAEELKLNQLINRINALKAKGIQQADFDSNIAAATASIKQLRIGRMRATVRLQEIEQEQLRQSRENNTYIQCKNRIHSGVQISFGPLTMAVNQSFVFSKVSVIDDNIAVSPMR